MAIEEEILLKINAIHAFFRGGLVFVLYEDKLRHMKSSYQSCIDACLQCADACDHCMSSCLREEHVHDMAKCIQLDIECATICRAAVKFMHLNSDHANAICQLCADVCNACADECEKHDMDHCRKCAEACRACAEECASMAAA